VSKKHRNTSLAKKQDRIAPVRSDAAPIRSDAPVSETRVGVTISTLALPSAAYPLTVVEAAGVSAVRRCVTLIANAIAGQRWSEWEGEPATRLPVLSRICRRPAAVMTRREWVWRCIAQMALTDISYIYMVGGVDDEGVPGSLLPLPKEAISPAGYADPWGIFPPTTYSITGISGTVSGEAVIPMRSAFWPGVPPHLQGILQMARNSLMQAWASDAYASRYWQAGGTPVTQITTEQALDDTQAAGLASRWRDRRSMGPDYPAVLGHGAHADPWGADVSGQLATEARRDIAAEVANLFGVASHYVNVNPPGSSMTYSNVQDEALSLDRFTLSGFYDPIQDLISDLLPEERFMLIDMTRLTRASQESRFRAWAIATGNKPWMVASEVRVEEGLAPNDTIDTLEEAQATGAEAAASIPATADEPVTEPEAEEVPA
jgi:HK97 family phage portal protein